MSSVGYEYQKPYNTYTLDQYIACQSDTITCYNNLSFIDRVDNIRYATYNVLSDYIDVIRDEYCVNVVLTDKELNKYKYRPKLLCHDVYSNAELAFIILLINDMYSAKQFTSQTLLMPKKDEMTQITKHLMNSNRSAIADYNYVNDKA
jgi:hypothetical protein